MSEIRYDPLSGHWVNIAAIRAQRPNEFRHIESRRPEAICPFCAGHESQTPPPILELKASAEGSGGDGTAWLVRVVPNKYPAFVPIARELTESHGPYRRSICGGLQEIIIQSPRHLASLSQLSDAELDSSFRACQDRVREAMHVAGVCQTTLFQNCRPEAGASIEHVHAQLVGSPVLTHALAARADRCAEYFRANRKSLLVATVDFELRDGGRIVEKRGRFVAFCPFASRSGFQVRIAATTPIETFDRVSLSDLRDVVWLLRSTIAKLERSFEGVPYNWVLHLPPNHSQDRLGPEVFPWFVEIIPRLGRWAGLELAEGGWINEWPPDYAAGKLRA